MVHVDDIIDLLKKKGTVIAIPTDTVYGLVCNAYDECAINKIYKLKGRDIDKPIGIFIKDISEIDKFVEKKDIPVMAQKIMKKFWPGALSIILKKKKELKYVGNEDSISIRIPANDLILEVLKKITFPLAQTSCNLQGRKPLGSADEIYKIFGDKLDLILDDKMLCNDKGQTNVSSTIISFVDKNMKIIRVGDIDISGYTN